MLPVQHNNIFKSCYIHHAYLHTLAFVNGEQNYPTYLKCFLLAIVFSDLLQSEIYKLGFWHNKIQSQALRVTYVDRILNIRRILMHFTDGSTQSTTGITEPPLLSGEIIDHVVEALADTDMTSLKSEIPLAALPTKIFSLLEKLFKKIDLEEGAELNHKVNTALFR